MQVVTHDAIRAKRTSPVRWHSAAMTAVILMLAVGAALLIGQGLYIHVKALVAHVLLERAFTQTLTSGEAVKPWSWGDTWPVARVAVPRLHASTIVLAGTSGQALAFGPGQLEGTPEPGDEGTAVYAGHRDTHFTFLADVVAGDDIVVTRRDGKVVRFRVTGTSVVRFDQSGIDPHAPGRRLALTTCWPFNARVQGPLRYVVHAQMIDEDDR